MLWVYMLLLLVRHNSTVEAFQSQYELVKRVAAPPPLQRQQSLPVTRSEKDNIVTSLSAAAVIATQERELSSPIFKFQKSNLRNSQSTATRALKRQRSLPVLELQKAEKRRKFRSSAQDPITDAALRTVISYQRKMAPAWQKAIAQTEAQVRFHDRKTRVALSKLVGHRGITNADDPAKRDEALLVMAHYQKHKDAEMELRQKLKEQKTMTRDRASSAMKLSLAGIES